MNDEAMIDESVLLHRALSRTATRSEWNELERVAVTDPAVWKRLADALRDECEIAVACGPALDRAAAIELPSVPAPLRIAGSPSRAGWLAAAALLLCWISTLLAVVPGRFDGGTTKTISHVPSDLQLANVANRANDSSETDIVSELPKLVVDTRNVAGGVEITYLRRIFERTRVDQVLGYAQNEAGQPTLVPISHTLPRSYEDF